MAKHRWKFARIGGVDQVQHPVRSERRRAMGG